MQTTIYALSSAKGRAGVALIRISGPHAVETLSNLAGELPLPRVAALRTLRDPTTRVILDRALVIWFCGPASFTGEDVVELHIHGGRAVIDAVLSALGRNPGMLPAEAGEFARRAFENGKLDLTAIEGLADLIDAETEAQRRQALRQSDGLLGRKYDDWRGKIVSALAEVEAVLDFSDEQDVSHSSKGKADIEVAGVAREIRVHLDDGRRGEILRDGLRVAIAGPVNAGKSSLLNAMAQRDAAIVSARPGTTRDVVEVRLDLNGYPVIVSDTAGLRETEEEIEVEGIRRALTGASEADLIIWLIDGVHPEACEPPAALKENRLITVMNKSDLLSSSDRRSAQVDHFVSVHTGLGIGDLVKRLSSEASTSAGGDHDVFLTRERHRQELERAAQALQCFLEGSLDDPELRCEDLRRAANCMGRLTGRIDVEEILDHIFGQFCIGK